jgi:cell division protein FtsI (penicillin-binding protein 3)
VMKTFAIAGALKEGILRPSTRYNCEGGHLKVGDKWIKEAEARDKFEWLTVTEILAKSSNVGAAKIAFDLGDERLLRALNDFGFGAKTGVELPGEARGIINPLPWRPHLLANVAFGHGIAVSPMQVAAAYAAIANGGVLKRPLLVKAIHTHSGDQPQEFQAEEVRRVLSPSQAATMRLMLTAATEDTGTGATARIPGYFVAGKTGTAQKVDTVHGGYIKNAYVSSFAGFVPANNPRYVIYIAVDNPRKSYYGGQVAAPVFARLAQYLVRRVGLPPVQISEHNVIPTDPEREHSHAQAAALKELKRETENTQHGGFPNLVGLSLREALARVHGEASQIDVHGYGVVMRTVPQAGTALDPKSRVTLVLENP